MPPLIINGSGRLVSNAGKHNADPRNFVEFRDLYVDAKGVIRKRPGMGAAVGASAGAAITSMHEYVYTHPTSGAETRWLFRSHAGAIQYLDRGSNTWTTMAWPSGFAPTAGGLWVFENIPIGITAYCLACNGKDEMIVFDGTSWKIAGVEGPATALGYQLGGIYGFGGSYGTTTTVNCTKGSKNITGVGGTTWLTFAEGPIPAGARIEINGNAYEVGSVTADGAITLTEQFKEADGVGLPYQIFYGTCEWENPPRYAVAYEDPTTGHSSNIRASSIASRNILELVEKDQHGRKITITGIPYSPSAYAQGYTKIRIYRSAKNASILQGLDTTINNSNVAGTTTFSESAATFVDTFLTHWPAQELKLAKPPAGFIAVKYHQGRVFALTRTRMYYSLHEADVVGELGVPALSWPATQWVSVNQPRGFIILGGEGGETTLVVQTALGDFAVVGYDQRVAPIGLVKLPTRGMESFQYGAVGTEGKLLSFYADAHVVDWPGNNDYAEDIQDKLDTLRASLFSGVRICHFKSRSWNLVLVSGPKTSGSVANDVTYIYDVSLDKWYQWTPGFSAFGIAKNPTTGERELWGSNASGDSYLLLQPNKWVDGVAATFAPYLKTAIARPLGDTADAELGEIQAFTSDASLTWAGELLIKEQDDGAGVATHLERARHQDASSPGKVAWRVPLGVRAKSQPFQISITFPATATDLSIEQIVTDYSQATLPRTNE